MTIEAGVLSIRVEETGGDKVIQQLSAIDKQASSLGSQSGGIAKATAAFSSMAATLGTLGIAISAGAAIEGVVSVVRKTIDAADAMHDLAQRTGVTTENLSVLSFAADKAGVDIDSVTVGFKKLSTELDKLESGDKKATEAFARLGLNAQDLKGLSLDQVFVKIADAQSKFADGAGKTAVMTELFGRSGERLIPLMHDLADGGFDKARQRAEELGLVIGGDLANNADALNDNIRDMHGAIDGLGQVFAITLLPPLTSFVQWMTDVIASSGRVLDFFSRLWHMGDDTSAKGTLDKMALLGAFFSGNFGQAAAILAGATTPPTFTRMGPPAPKKPDLPTRGGDDAKESAADRARARALAKALGADLGDIPLAEGTVTTPTGPTPTVGVDKSGKMKGVKGDPAKMLADLALGSDEKIRQQLEEKKQFITGLAQDVAGSIGGAFGDAFTAAFSGDDNFFAALGKSLLKSLGNMIMQLGESMIEYAALTSVLGFVPGPWQALGLGAISAGLAGVGLVALGAGMGALGGKGGHGHGGGSSGGRGASTQPGNNQWSVAFDPDKKGRAVVPGTRSIDGAKIPDARQPIVNNWTIIGPDDPSAQRSIKKLLYNADRRGVTGR